ncbi:MAG: T9SS type B sorting domain-containing protein, partial [Bacteroidales bacterium]|nr:T9SS type B sorting domain-containing protein [Bacteroidales bacterium]
FDWALKFGTSADNDAAGDVTCDINNKVYVLYYANQIMNNAQVAVRNSNGFFNSSFGFGGSGSVIPKGITVDNYDNIYISGIYSGLTNFGDGDIAAVGNSDYFITKHKSNGNFVFKSTAGSLFSDGATSICLDNNNNVIVGGFCNNNIYFDGIAYPAQTKDDALIVKYNTYFSFSEIITSSINCDPNNICIDIVVSGGTAPFTFYVDNNISNSSVCGLSMGNHQIIVTDANDCYIETTINLSTPTAAPINIPSEITACFHDTITLDATSNYIDYLWSTPDAATTQTIEVYDGGHYTVSVTDAYSCTTSATVFVNELPDKDLFVLHELFLCPNESISVQVAGYSNYLWFDGSTSTSHSFTDSGEYWLQAFDGSCWYYDTLTITKLPKPAVNLGGNLTVCEGDSVEIYTDTNFASYLWQDNSTNETYWASETESVFVVVTDNNACTASDTISVTSIPAEDISLGADTTVCTSKPFILDPNDTSANNTYLWSIGDSSNTLSVSSTGQYWVEVTNFAGCISTDTITLTIFPEITLDLGEDISFCTGESDTITVIETYNSYEWSTGSTDNYLFVDSSGIYYLTVTDLNGCSANDFIYVTESTIEPPFLGYDTTLCKGDVYILEPEGVYYSYKWNDGSTTGYQRVTNSGFFSLTVSDAIGCTSSSSINIDFAESPEILNAISGGGTIEIILTGGTEPYLYSHDGDTWQTSNTFNQLSSDFYTIWVMDSNYCMDTIDTYLDVSINIPKFFTPNGDGYNDYWRISGLYQYPEAFVQIFDRYGKKLYEFTNNDIGWNGTYGGHPVPSDTYWYSITLEKDRKPLTGHVTIKR